MTINLCDLTVGSKISLIYSQEEFVGTITDIVPTDDRHVKKYIIESPTSVSNGEEYATLWLYDGDEDEWQVMIKS